MFNTSFRTLISCLVVVLSTAICALAVGFLPDHGLLFHNPVREG